MRELRHATWSLRHSFAVACDHVHQALPRKDQALQAEGGRGVSQIGRHLG